MSLHKITPDNFEVFTIETHPSRSFISSSLGVSGAVNLFSRRSASEKEVFPLSMFTGSIFNDKNLETLRLEITRNTGSSNIQSELQTYLGEVNSQTTSARLGQQLQIYRYNPPFTLNKLYQSKVVTSKVLMPFYRANYPTAHYGFSNYHCLNFRTSSMFPSNAVLLYPNPTASVGNDPNASVYGVTGAFSFDFWIKPVQTTDNPGNEYRAGTIMHLTGAYALSLITGSHRDINGYPDKYRLLLQLSSSANVSPSLATAGTYTIFSDDNVLERNKWNHVTVRWGDRYNLGSGSFVVNGLEAGTFVLPTSSIGSTGSVDMGSYRYGEPSVLCIGNYYNGPNTGTSALSRFFAADTATREGLLELDTTDGVFAPTVFAFSNPLSAEIHDLKLFDKYLLDHEISMYVSGGASTTSGSLKFYVPPFFTREAPTRQSLNGFGGVLTTPFQERDGTTTTPFNPFIAYSVGGQYMNLENFTREFVRGYYPRLWALSASIISTTTTTELTANAFLYTTGSNRYRQYLAYPCDNGKFVPNFDLINSLSPSSSLNDLGVYNPGWISLNNQIGEFYTSQGLIALSGSIVDEMIGASPENIAGANPNSYAILHRTRDTSSNQVVLFDISNMFYGQQIKPGTFLLKDTSLSSSAGMSVLIKDDGFGNLYRADTESHHASWASVGNIFYNEGIVLIKAPQLYFLGEQQFEIGFQGSNDIHVAKYSLQAYPLMYTSSSNPSYMSLSASSNVNEIDQKFVYVTNVYIHDDNMNIIMKTQMAQPIVKKTGDKIMFKIGMDF